MSGDQGSDRRPGRNMGGEEHRKMLFPDGRVPIPDYDTLQLQEKAKNYVDLARSYYRDLLDEETDQVLARESDEEWKRQVAILKNVEWLKEGVSERIVAEYPDLLRRLRSRLADLRGVEDA